MTNYQQIIDSIAIAVCLLLANQLAFGQQGTSELLTVAEKSEYEATSRFQDVADFVDVCAKRADHVTRLDFGKSVESRPMISAVVADPPYEMGSPDQRLRVLLIGNIHSGECAGKEALLMILRELAENPDHPWLKDAVIVIAPNYNVDANERVGKFHRPGQQGPVRGMGQRANPQQLDLNRDFIKLESPEARSLVSLMNQFDPHMFIDCHTTNGSRHRYLLTYDIPHNPSSPQAIRQFLRKRMMPQVTADLELKGVPTFYYGNFSRDGASWVTYGYLPRYSTEYFGLRGGLGILAEAYSYAPYKTRIVATKAFVEQCVNYVRAHANDVKNLLTGLRQEQAQQGTAKPIHLDAEMTAFDDPVVIRGFEGDEPKDYELRFLSNFEPTKTVLLPYAYLLPGELSLQAERLAMHGIQIERLLKDTQIPVEVSTITALRKRQFEFQKHNTVSVETKTRSDERKINAGTYLVRTTQPLGKLAAYMLEPESNDGLVTWNFMDAWLAEGREFPVLQINAAIPLELEAVTKFAPGRLLRLADIYGPNKLNLGGGQLRTLTWQRGGNTYVAERNGRRVQVDGQSGAERRLQVPWDRRELPKILGQVEGLDRSTIAEMQRKGADVRSADQTMFIFKHNDVAVALDSTKGRAKRLGTEKNPAELATVDPTGKKLAFVQNGNLMLVDSLDAEPYAITTDGSDTILNGKLDWVYQEELYGRGNFKGFWWSPDANAIVFIRIDESPVHLYTVTDHIPVRGRYEITPYPKAGDPLPKVKLGIFHLDSKQLVWADLPNPDNDELLISQVGWNPAGDAAIVQVQNRQQTWLDLYAVDKSTADFSLLFRDQTPAWIESPGNPVWLDDGSFLWLSPRSGFNHIYQYDSSGSMIGQLTDGGWEVRQLLGVSKDNKKVFFTGAPQTPTQVHALVVDIDGKNFRNLTPEDGSHSVKFNDDFTMFFDEFSSVSGPANVKLYTADGTFVRTIAPNIQDELRHFKLSTPEFVRVPIADGVILNGLMIKPADFDPQKKYPVLVHVYSGPQAPRVRNRFDGARYLWHQFLAQQGYVIWMCDNRSASYHGAQFAWPIHRDLGRNELADIEAGLDWLTRNRWVDSDRIGIWGWSYGGYMTAYAMTHSKLFKAGISGAPVTDWKNYDAIYTERYMDTPQNNPSGYNDSSVLTSAKELHGSLLLIHGTIDDNVHISNSMQFAYELQKAGKQFQMMVYPKNRHGVRDPDQQLHLYQLMTGFIIKNL